MSVSNFHKIKNLRDIKLEKSKLRYEMLVAEQRLVSNFESIENMFSFTSYISRITYGFNIARQVYENIDYYMDKFMFWKKKPADKQKEAETE